VTAVARYKILYLSIEELPKRELDARAGKPDTRGRGDPACLGGVGGGRPRLKRGERKGLRIAGKSVGSKMGARERLR